MKPYMKPLPDTPFYRAMASGHLRRTGHELKAFLRNHGATYKLVRQCCTTADETAEEEEA